MKPEKLTLSGWGPYKGLVSVDFSQFDDGTVFLITGPTGSGKTTLFDGISYGLFGVPSGSFREKDSLRSDFADADTETFVILEFEHHRKLYKITRYPKYSRPKKRGKGEIISNERAVLEFPDDRVIEKLTEVNAAITQLLGIDDHQFKQIAMIAQGEFQNLLVADSQKRVEIFRNIFGTRLFKDIQNKFIEKSKELYGRISRLDIKIQENAASVLTEGHEALRLALENGCTGEVPKLLAAAVAQDKETIRAIEQEIKVYDAEMACLTEAGQRALDSQSGMCRQKEVLLKRQQECRTARESYEAALTQYQKKTALEDALAAAKAEAAVLEARLSETGEAKRCADEAAQAKKCAREQSEIYTQYMQRSELLSEALKKITAVAEGLSGAEIEAVLVQKEIEALRHRDSAYAEHLKLAQNLKKRLAEHRAAAEKLDGLENEMKLAAEAFENQQLLKLKYAAGILAKDLADGVPCPVCGATVHPHPAPLGHRIVSDEALAKLKKRKESAERVFQDALQVLTVLFAGCQSLAGRLLAFPFHEEDLEMAGEMASVALNMAGLKETSVQKISVREDLSTEEMTCLADRAVRVFGECRQNSGSRIIALEKSCNILEAKIRDYQKTRKKQSQLERELELLGEKVRKQQMKVSKTAEFYAEKRGIAEACLKKYPDVQAEYTRIQGKIKQNEADMPKLAKTLEKIQKDFDAAKDFLAKCSGQEAEAARMLARYEKAYQMAAETLKAETDRIAKKLGINDEKTDGDCLNDEKTGTARLNEKLADGLEKMRSRYTSVKIQISRNQHACAGIRQYLGEKQRLEKLYGDVRDIENIVRGNNPKKLEFEQYVLAAYFAEILEAANLRLDQMSGGRYSLLQVQGVADRRKKNSLDIDVFDQYTGKRRSVKTLSGGESFKAALSLALGLSDVIACHAGGIQMDMLFIDEGFGSLDEVSVQSAVDTLMRISSGRHMTGIISHVAELKERIGHQIVIETGDEGSRIRIQGE